MFTGLEYCCRDLIHTDASHAEKYTHTPAGSLKRAVEVTQVGLLSLWDQCRHTDRQQSSSCITSSLGVVYQRQKTASAL